MKKNKVTNTILCFVNNSDSELINKIELLGYEIKNNIISSEINSLCTSLNDIVFLSNYEKDKSFNETKEGKNYIDCGTNTELFLALAAVNNSNDYMQWFTNGNAWKLCEKNDWTEYFQYIPIYEGFHKATKDEILYYFNNLNSKGCLFSWHPENATTIYDDFISIEDAIKAAKEEFSKSTGEFYGIDNRYSPRICIGEVEFLDYNNLANNCFDLLKDLIKEHIEWFSFGTCSENELCVYDETVTKHNIESLLKTDFYISPSKKLRTYKGVYDLLLDKWIIE